MINWTITLGNLVEIFGIILGGILFLSKMTATAKLFAYRLENVERAIISHSIRIDTIRDAMVLMARQEERLNSLSARIEEVRNMTKLAAGE